MLGGDAGSCHMVSNQSVGAGHTNRLCFLVPLPALPPPLRADIFQVEASSTVVISSDLFSEENGQIEYYGVVATTNDSRKCPCAFGAAVAPLQEGSNSSAHHVRVTSVLLYVPLQC